MNRFKLKPIAMLAIAAGALVAAAVAIFASSSKAPDKPAASVAAVARPALTVTTTQAQLSALPIKLAANGTIAAWQEASIGAESNSLRLAEVLVNVGDVVQRGQLLARFADDSVQADVAQARAGVTEATANAFEASANADRVRTLQSTGTFSGQQINQYLTAEQTARARVESAKAALTAQQVRLKNTLVLAPDSGVISVRAATVGAVPGTGTELFRLIRQARLEWRAEVTSTELGRMAAGTAVTVTAASGTQLMGRVRMVAPTVDPQTRAGLVYVDLPPMQTTSVAAAAAPGRPKPGTSPPGGSAVREATSVGANSFAAGPPQGETTPSGGSAVRVATSVGATVPPPGRPQGETAPSGGSAAHAVASVGATVSPPGRSQGETTPSGGSAVRVATSVGAIKPGMFARGEFELGNSNALTVPQQAVVVRDGFNYVFRLNADQRVSQVKLQIGRRVGERVEVLEGIGADAVLVAQGAGFLNDGDLVKVAPAPDAVSNKPPVHVLPAQAATK